MDSKTTNDRNNGQENQDPQPKKSWLKRNLWMVAVFIAIFLLRMCNELS
ncbi:MAG: hypothetical protein ACI3ZZ_04820 [Candidatus Aphodosoma sp.]